MNKLAAVFISVALILSASHTTGQANRASLPQSSLVLPTVKRDTLLNGLQLIVLEQRGTGTVSAHLRINSGAMFDLAGKGGLADLTAALLLKGGGGWNAKAVADAIEQLGLTLKVTVGWDSTDIEVGGPADALESIFDLLGRLIITPAFDAKEFEAAKAERVQALKTQSASDRELATNKALEAVFGSHPYGHRLTGSPESIVQIGRHDLSYYHGRFYAANNAELAISGDTTAEEVTRRARAKLGAWKKGDKVPASFRPPEALQTPRVFVLDRATDATVLACIAQVGPSRRAADYFAAMIAGDLLAQSNAKLGSESGAAIETRLDPRYLEGPLTVVIKVPQSGVKGAVEEVLANFSRFQSSQPSLEHVEASKARIVSAFAEKLRTPQGALDLLLDIELYGLGRDYLVSFVDRVNSVAPGDVMRAAQSYLKPQSVAVVVAGPASELEAPLKKLGTITVLK